MRNGRPTFDVYLASPYSHPDHEAEELRFVEASRYAGRLVQQGKRVFSPIAHSHPLKVHGGAGGSWSYWEEYDRACIEASEELHVLMLDGWRESVGVAAEVQIATELHIPIRYVQPKESA